MTVSLYKVTEELDDILYGMDPDDPEYETKLLAVLQKYDDKNEIMVAAVRTNEGLSNLYDEEIKYLQIKKEQSQRRIKYMKDEMLRAMIILDLRKIETKNGFIISRVNNQPRLEIASDVDISKLPKDCQRIKYEADKRALIQRYQETKMLPNGVRYIEGEEHIRIK